MQNKRYIMGWATASSQYEGAYKEGGRGLDTQDCRPYLKNIWCDNIYKTTHTRYCDEAKKCEGIGYYPFRQGSDGYHHIDDGWQREHKYR